MLQRIQTLYLLIAAIIMGSILFIPYGEIILKDTQIVKVTSLGTRVAAGDTITVFRTYPVFVIALLSFLVTIVSIFLYKKRILQIRLCVLNFILVLSTTGLMFLYIYRAAKYFDATVYHGFLMVLPLVAAILLWLTIRAIGKDEALVRSIDRIR